MDLDEFQKVLDACSKAMAELPELKKLREEALKLTESEFQACCKRNHSAYFWITANHHATESALGFVAAVQVLLECNEARQIQEALNLQPLPRGGGIIVI